MKRTLPAETANSWLLLAQQVFIQFQWCDQIGMLSVCFAVLFRNSAALHQGSILQSALLPKVAWDTFWRGLQTTLPSSTNHAIAIPSQACGPLRSMPRIPWETETCTLFSRSSQLWTVRRDRARCGRSFSKLLTSRSRCVSRRDDRRQIIFPTRCGESVGSADAWRTKEVSQVSRGGRCVSAHPCGWCRSARYAASGKLC